MIMNEWIDISQIRGTIGKDASFKSKVLLVKQTRKEWTLTSRINWKGSFSGWDSYKQASYVIIGLLVARYK